MAKAISGHVLTARYIRLPTSDRYGVRVIQDVTVVETGRVGSGRQTTRPCTIEVETG